MTEPPPCPVCLKTATLMCASCHFVFYCTNQHQKEDWPRHKPQCRACKVFDSPQDGYCLKATRDISEGEVIFTETPFIIGPAHFSESPCCVGCSCALPTEADPLSKCPECQWAACCPNCPALSDPAGHAVECAMLKLVVDKSCPWPLLLPYRCMLLQKSNPRMWKWLLEHASRALANQADKSERFYSATVLEVIARTIFKKDSSFLPLDYSTETLNKIYAVLDVYGLYFWTSHRKIDLTGLYETAGFLKLSCVANTRTDFYGIPDASAKKTVGAGRVVVSALRDIRQGEILSCSYALPLSSTFIRQSELARRNLVCRCPRCLDPREMGFDAGTMKCTSCPGWILPLDTLSIGKCIWACDRKCGVTRTAKQVLNRFQYFSNLCQDIAKPGVITSMKPETMEVMLAEFLTELHPNHELCFLLRSFMLKTYCFSNEYAGLRSLNDEHLERRAVLCREMLDAIDRFGPNIYRVETTVVFALKEFIKTQFELTQRRFQSANWTTDRATRNVVHCLMLLERALKILQTTVLDFDTTTSMQGAYCDILGWAHVNGLRIPENVDPAMLLEPQ